MKTFLIVAVSANGMIAQTAGQQSLDWTSKEDLAFFVSKTKEVGVVILGRKTFEMIGKPLKGRLNMVMTSSTEGKASELGVLEYTSADAAEILRDLEARGYKQAAICGGSEIYSLFLREGLVDELYLTVEPVLFGSGVPLTHGFDRLNLELLDTTMLNAQAILLHYRVVH